MDLKTFKAHAEAGTIPEGIPPLLRALLLDAAGDWDGAHRIAQSDYSRDGSHVHAYLHREEGDLGNASYWYRNAGVSMPDHDLRQEWEELAAGLIDQSASANTSDS